ncbi:Methyltransferase type 11 [Desulfovibrio sp. X2]|uniref:class I SAM-dependent methyltransferase n=1 Tax=Desulfovibrio sp. X2 TaxID=941449 RepID=UPI000358860A|nr:class I SAM-dependent methyltransferase [Desulfovibrio sp. X2]EPR37151.1 Methyltransferase type 11 [Desulfovibrio sp. X2]
MSEHIKDYWESQGKSHGASHWASWGDNWMIDLEIETIGAHIKPGDTVIDVGCANGYSTFRQLDERKPAAIVGVDFAQNMIDAARGVLATRASTENVSFQVGDVRDLCFEDGRFDVAYTTRVLINLPTWEEQKKGIRECLRILRPGGKLVLSEGFWEPLCLLNAMRQLKSLPPLVEHDFNRYLKKSNVEKFLDDLGASFEFEDFSSIYYLGSRFLRELVTDPSQYEGFTNPINKIFFEIERQYSGGGFGIQQAVVITK